MDRNKRDGFDEWAASNGLPATAQIEGDEVVLETSPDLEWCSAGHPPYAGRECVPCVDEEIARGDGR